MSESTSSNLNSPEPDSQNPNPNPHPLPSPQLQKFLTLLTKFRTELTTSVSVTISGQGVSGEDNSRSLVPISSSLIEKPSADAEVAPSPSRIALKKFGSFISMAYQTTKQIIFNQKKVIIFLSSLRENSGGLRICEFLKREMSWYNMIPVVFDPKQMIEHLITNPDESELNNPTMTPQWLETLNSDLQESAGFITLCPDYDDTEPLPGPLTTMLDLFPPESFANKPCALIGYSQSNYYGDSRLRKLRQHLLFKLTVVPLPSNVILPNLDKYLNEDGNDKGSQRLGSLLTDLQYCIENVDLKAILANTSSNSAINDNQKRLILE